MIRYFIQDNDLNNANLMHLFYDFKLALVQEDFEYCRLICTEFERRKELDKIHPEFIAALLDFNKKYSPEDKEDSTKVFHDLIEKILELDVPG